MYKLRIQDDKIFRDKINSDKIIIESDLILDKHTLLTALAQWKENKGDSKRITSATKLCNDCPYCEITGNADKGTRQFKCTKLNNLILLDNCYTHDIKVHYELCPFEHLGNYCRTNPTADCPNCPRYKVDCEGLEQYEDIFGIQDELDKLTIRPDGVDCMGR